MRVSTIVISALTAIAVQKLAYSAITTSLASSDDAGDDSGTPEQSNQTEIVEPQPVNPIAQPEVMTQKPTVATKTPVAAAKGQSLFNSPALLSMPAGVPLPPPPPIINPPMMFTAMKPEINQVVDQVVDTEVSQSNAKARRQAAVIQAIQTQQPGSIGLVDIQGHWAQRVIESLYQRGIVQGTGNGNFRPEELVTPEQFAKMVDRASLNSLISYQDLQSFDRTATRAEAAVFVYQWLVKIGQAPLLNPQGPLPTLAQAPPTTSENPPERVAATPGPGDRAIARLNDLPVSPQETLPSGVELPPPAPATVSQPLSVHILGEVSRPGAYQLDPQAGKLPTLIQALQRAGGVTRSANLRQVEIRRLQAGQPEQRLTLNLWDLMQQGSLPQNLPLQDGDTILIPALTGIDWSELPTTTLNAAGNWVVPTQIVSSVAGLPTPAPSPASFSSNLTPGTERSQPSRAVTTPPEPSTLVGTQQPTPDDLWQLLYTGNWQLLQTKVPAPDTQQTAEKYPLSQSDRSVEEK